jgi:gentisate 1,2-dioxygenase
MSFPSPSDLARSSTLEELYRKLDEVGMGPGWNKPTPSLWPAPRKTLVAAHWKYELARGALDAAGRLINTALAERRNLILFNPAEGNTYGTVRTLVAAYQMIMPGEWARVHRHTPNALRLILDAEPGTYTEVDGVDIAMAPGDVLLTPNWSTHGHGNRGKACAYWLDFLDAPLVQLLEPMFFEAVEDEGGHTDVPAGKPGPAPATMDSPFVFTLEDTLRRLGEAKPEPRGPFATQIELGHPALATTALYMMKLAPGIPTAPYRTTANNIYAVANGSNGGVATWSRHRPGVPIGMRHPATLSCFALPTNR